jgi:ribosomal protein S18 acetylase RimI-like enzyme
MRNSMQEIRPYKEVDETQVIQIWTDCGLVVPWNDPKADIKRKLAVQRHLFLVGCVEGKVVATVMAGYEGHRGWINYLAVKPDHQGTGIGRLMVQEAERLLRAEGCPKINLQVRSANDKVINFYESIGYKIDDVLSLGKRTEGT